MKRPLEFDQLCAANAPAGVSPHLRFTCEHPFVVKLSAPTTAGGGSAAKKSLDDGTLDSVDFTIHFRPHMTMETARLTTLSVHYKNVLVFRQHVAGAAGTEGHLVLRPVELEYHCYDTHALHTTGPAVQSLYLTLCNNSTDPRQVLRLEPHVSMKRYMEALHRFTALHWFPPDVSPSLYGLRIDPASIPQRTPLWFQMRGCMSGTKAYKLLGFYVPTLEQDPTWNINGTDETFDAQARARMRLGSLSEDCCAITYLHAFPLRSFAEVGWCDAPRTGVAGALGYPIGWGASPDGVLTDPDMDWDAVPDDVRAHWEPLLGGDCAAATPRRGAAEFKTSRTKLSFEPYFLPQVAMEMIALGVVWCDLSRYRPHDIAHVYRVWRDPALEQRFMGLWRRAMSCNSQELQRLVHTDRAYIDVRADLTRMARAMEPYAKIDAPADQCDAYERERERLLAPGRA